MKNLARVLLILLFGSFLTQDIVNAQKYPAVYTISKDGQSYYGDGISWIMEEHQQFQFILFGEQHGVDGIAELVQFIYDSLSEKGFENLVLEMDRWTASALETIGIDSFINKYPHSIAFDYNGDLALIASNIEKDNSNLWGVDQMVTAIHPFQHLSQIAPNFNARRLTRGAFIKSSLKAGEYLPEEHFRDLDVIGESFGENKSDEVALILNDLRRSMDIYTKWRAGSRGEISKSISPEIRESLMKNRLDSYLESNSNNGKIPKAIFKMGGAHTMYGIGPNGVETLGEHAKNIALSNNMKTLSIGIRRFNEKSNFPSLHYFDDSDIILVDNSSYLKARSVDSTLPPLTKFDSQYDALIYLKDAPRASKSVIYSKEKLFKQSLLIKVGLLAIFALLILTSGVLLIIQRKYKGSFDFKNQKRAVVTLFAFSIFTNILLWVQVYFFLNYPIMKATILPGIYSLLLFAGLLILVSYLLFLSYRSWEKKWWSTRFRSYFSLLTIFSFLLSLMMYWWNIGGMIG